MSPSGMFLPLSILTSTLIYNSLSWSSFCFFTVFIDTWKVKSSYYSFSLSQSRYASHFNQSHSLNQRSKLLALASWRNDLVSSPLFVFFFPLFFSFNVSVYFCWMAYSSNWVCEGSLIEALRLCFLFRLAFSSLLHLGSTSLSRRREEKRRKESERGAHVRLCTTRMTIASVPLVHGQHIRLLKTTALVPLTRWSCL